MDERITDGSGASVGLAFVQGAVVGAIAALLLAPRSGRELRQQLREYGNEAGKRAREVADRGGEVVQRTVEKGRQVAGEAYQAGQAAMERERRRVLGEQS
jgi:gas vesicle protein